MTEDRGPYNTDGLRAEMNTLRERLERDIESLIAAFVARTGAAVAAVTFRDDDPVVRVRLEGESHLRTVS